MKYLLRLIGLLMLMMFGGHGFAVSSTAKTEVVAVEHGMQMDTQKAEETQQQLSQLLLSKDYTTKYETKVWQKVRKSPLEEWMEDFLENISEAWDDLFGWKSNTQRISQQGGVFSKTVVLVLLFLALGWLYKNRQLWLTWFSNLKNAYFKTSAKIDEDWYQQADDDGYHLPNNQQLSKFIHQALQNQQWLLALSLLYRGTLREIAQTYHLPINQSSTEQQCQWLLSHADQQTEHEAKFFQQLVILWSQVAYGKKIPKDQNLANFHHQIQGLLTSWEKLYLSDGQRES